MNLSLKLCPQKPGDIEVGAWYRIRGTDSSGLPIPNQVIFVKTAPEQYGVTGRPFIKVKLFASLGLGMEKIGPWDTTLFLDSVSIPPIPGRDSKWLEKVAQPRSALLDKNEYPDIINEP